VRGLSKRKREKRQVKKVKHDREAGSLAHMAMIFQIKELSRVDLKMNRKYNQGRKWRHSDCQLEV